MFSRKNLRVCDLSYNEMHGPASRALADFFHEEPTVLYSLKMTHCGLRCSDMDLIARGLIAHSNERQKGTMNHQLRELVIDSNRIKVSINLLLQCLCKKTNVRRIFIHQILYHSVSQNLFFNCTLGFRGSNDFPLPDL